MANVERCLVSLFFILLAVLPSQKNHFQADLDRILNSLLREESFRKVHHHNHRVAIGFGSSVDVFVDGVELLKKLDISPPSLPVHHDVIASDEDLAESFAYFFQYGAAAERYTSNTEAFQQWVKVARTLSGSRDALGGNAPVMAIRFAGEGWSVLLGAQLKDTNVHKRIKVVGNTSSEARDDIHLIFEYNLGTTWGEYKSPRANRYIVHNDYSNMMLDTLDSFLKHMDTFNPSLVIVSGLQMLDNFPLDPELRTQQLKKISQALKSLPTKTKIHFEMASITEELLMSELVEYILPHVDSVGMNEQELANLCSFFEYGNVTIVTDPYPRVATTLDKIRQLYNYLRSKNDPKGHTLSRIHVHTLAYQAILISQHSNWRNMHGAIAKASLTANRHVCASNNIDTTRAKVIMDDSFSVSTRPGSHRMPLIDSAPIACWGEDTSRICVAPNLVCTTVQQTAGGGDNISAAGLVLQL